MILPASRHMIAESLSLTLQQKESSVGLAVRRQIRRNIHSPGVRSIMKVGGSEGGNFTLLS
jgi:hypothetical protein